MAKHGHWQLHPIMQGVSALPGSRCGAWQTVAGLVLARWCLSPAPDLFDRIVLRLFDHQQSKMLGQPLSDDSTAVDAQTHRAHSAVHRTQEMVQAFGVRNRGGDPPVFVQALISS